MKAVACCWISRVVAEERKKHWELAGGDAEVVTRRGEDGWERHEAIRRNAPKGVKMVFGGVFSHGKYHSTVTGFVAKEKQTRQINSL